MAAAIFPSVTVSMGELTMGVRRRMFLVMLEDKSTCQICGQRLQSPSKQA